MAHSADIHNMKFSEVSRGITSVLVPSRVGAGLGLLSSFLILSFAHGELASPHASCQFAIELPRSEASVNRSVASVAEKCSAIFSPTSARPRRSTSVFPTPESAANEKLIRAGTHTRAVGQLMANERAAQLETVSRLSLEELEHEADAAITSMTKRRGYMPGCQPTWTPANVVELIKDHQKIGRGGSQLAQIVGNLKTSDGYIDFMLMMPPEMALSSNQKIIVNEWLLESWALRVFEELGRRLDQIGEMGPRVPHSVLQGEGSAGR
jgi:hypothetical protein